MTLLLVLFLVLSAVELLVVTSWTKPIRQPLAAVLAIALALVSGGILGVRFSLATVLFSVITLYRVINLLRLVSARVDDMRLVSIVRRSTVSLVAMQIAVLATLAVADALHPLSDTWWMILAIMQLCAAALLYRSTSHQLSSTAPFQLSEHLPDSQLPSLSVCIPARNETSALAECLQSLLASDYPKLEIIVLDDCSQGTRTSEVIRSFAHDGVRFIQGGATPNGWLAKNWAYHQLLQAASGSHVLFCGVDVRFTPSTLRYLVSTILLKDKSMLSVMPRNEMPGTSLRDQIAILLQPIRYAWELCLPRRRFNRPPVLSSCWVAERPFLVHHGGFMAVTKSITPEAHFAKQAIQTDAYSFMAANESDEVVSQKSVSEQWATAVRTRYPQLHRRMEMVLLVSLVELSLFCAPFAVCFVGLLQGLWVQALAAALASLVVSFTYARIVNRTYRRMVPQGYMAVPIAILLDVYIRHESLWRYEFGEITWKGRNVCLPVMQAIPRLPKV